MFDPALTRRAEALLESLKTRGWRLATAESCTGGLIAALLTEIPGSSAVVERGFIAYSNQAKAELLGVPPELIAAHGAVSEPVARMMAEEALRRSHADIAVSVTGIAGPGGATPTKPVGLVHFGLAAGRETLHLERRYGDLTRSAIRRASVEDALALLEQAVAQETATGRRP
jgi:nicotinamide-nucleotide amidase